MASKNEYMGADTSAGFSANLWGDCGVIDDPTLGYLYFDHFLGPIDPTSTTGYTITQTTSGDIHAADVAGGALAIDSAANATADDGINCQQLDADGGENWKPAAGKTLWYETRCKFADAATTPDQHFVGLCDRETAIIASGDLDTTGRSLVGFWTDASTTAGRIGFVSAKAGSANEDADLTGAAAIADDTFVKLGFKVFTTLAGDLKITPYINGTAYTSITDTDDIPIVLMALSWVAQCEQTSANAIVTIDWIRVAQLY